MLGVGQEDLDYGLRMAMLKVPTANTICLGLNNYVVDEENPGWKDVSKKVSTSKYALVNIEFFKTKWITSEINPEMKLGDFKYIAQWGHGAYHFSPKTDEPTPLFYDFSVLDHKNITRIHYAAYKAHQFKQVMEKIVYKLYKKIFS